MQHSIFLMILSRRGIKGRGFNTGENRHPTIPGGDDCIYVCVWRGLLDIWGDGIEKERDGHLGRSECTYIPGEHSMRDKYHVFEAATAVEKNFHYRTV